MVFRARLQKEIGLKTQMEDEENGGEMGGGEGAHRTQTEVLSLQAKSTLSWPADNLVPSAVSLLFLFLFFLFFTIFSKLTVSINFFLACREMSSQSSDGWMNTGSKPSFLTKLDSALCSLQRWVVCFFVPLFLSCLVCIYSCANRGPHTGTW